MNSALRKFKEQCRRRELLKHAVRHGRVSALRVVNVQSQQQVLGFESEPSAVLFICQALNEDMPICTGDSRFADYDVQLVW